jgi:hypothetical protein
VKALVALLVALAVGFVAGLLWSGKPDQPSPVASDSAALAAMQQARDSLQRVLAENPRVETTVVIRTGATRLRVDTVRVPASTRVMIESVYVADSAVRIDTAEIVVFDFQEATAAYTIEGTVRANCTRPQMSFVDYKLDIHAEAICPRRFRLSAGGGLLAGRPFVGAMFQIKRLRFGPLLAVESADRELIKPRFGALAFYDLR